MAWPNPFHRRDENTRTCWGYTFQLTSDHLTPEQTRPLKFSYDALGEQVLDKLNEVSPPGQKPTVVANGKAKRDPEQVAQNESSGGSRRDLYVLLKEHMGRDGILGEFWDQIHSVPEWVDWDQIARGQDVFYRYGGAALTGLAFQSLLGGMGATRVVETLARTGGFSVKVARHRLFETTQHILECTRSLESIQPGGAGHASSIRVRLLHVAVRQRILKLARERPQYYDVERWGIPINDLDCIATIGTFSATLIWISFPRQGIWLRKGEIEDYVALWRLIAHYTGSPTEYFKTPTKAKAAMETLLLYEIDPSETSKILANNVVKCLESQPPAYASAPFICAQARWLNGHELCDRLDLPRPSPYYSALMAGQCIFFISLCYTHRALPFLDARKIAALRRVFWAVIVDARFGLGKPSVFDFKHVPDFHVHVASSAGRRGFDEGACPRDVDVDASAGAGSDSDADADGHDDDDKNWRGNEERRRPRSRPVTNIMPVWRREGIEWRNLKALCLAGVVGVGVLGGCLAYFLQIQYY